MEPSLTESESGDYGNLRVRFSFMIKGYMPQIHRDTKIVENCEFFYYIPTVKSGTIDTESLKGDKGRCVRRSYQFVSGSII